MSPTWHVEGRDREKVDDLHFAHLWLAQALGEKYILSPIRTELTKSGTSGYFTINAIGCAFYKEREIRNQRQDQGPLATAIVASTAVAATTSENSAKLFNSYHEISGYALQSLRRGRLLYVRSVGAV
jgi:hypothetical protein